MINSAIAVGTFDGFHRGHFYLTEQLLKAARKEKLKTIVITLASPVKPVPGVLTTTEEKVELLRELPLDSIVVLPTSREVIDQPAIVFFEEFLCRQLHLKHLVIGRNFAFGFGRQGNVEWLRRVGPSKGVQVTVVRPLRLQGDIISSTRIRTLIESGKIECANELLGRVYEIRGVCEKGRGVGSTIGFPTINVRVAPEKLLPQGVYTATVKDGDTLLPAVMNIGVRPTFFDGGKKTVEIHLLNFRGRWTKRDVRLCLHKHLRKELKFPSIEELRKRIALDKTEAERYFQNNVHDVDA